MYSSTKVQVLSRIPAASFFSRTTGSVVFLVGSVVFFSVRKIGVYHIVEVGPDNMRNRLSPAVFCSFKLSFDAAAFQATVL